MITATSSATPARSSAAQPPPTKPLDRDAFLKLLITQLRNQDPLKPMDDTQFISQLAQFSSLEQMQSMNNTMEGFAAGQVVSQAVGMIGHTIKAIDPKTGDLISDRVTGVKIEDGIKLVTSTGKQVLVGYVIGVE